MLENSSDTSGVPVVYMTEDISPEGLMKVYQALGKEAVGERVAVKISTGETGSNYLRPELIGYFCQFRERDDCGMQYGLWR